MASARGSGRETAGSDEGRGEPPTPLSRAELEAVLSIAADALICADDDDRITLFNAAAERTFGVSAADVLGHPVEELLPEGIARPRAVLPGGSPASLSQRRAMLARRPSGEEFPVDASVAQVEHDGRRIRAVLLKDMTEQLRAEERSRRLLRENAARVAADAAERRTRVLAEAGAILASSLDYQGTLEAIARFTTSTIADYCVTYLEQDGAVRRAAVAHADPTIERLVRALQRMEAPDRASDTGAGRVIRTGETIFAPVVTDDMLRQTTRDPEYLALLKELKPRSSIIAPLRARGRTLGALAVVTTENGKPPYGDADVALVEDLARRAALAADNARLYQAQGAATDAAIGLADRLQRLLELASMLSSAMTVDVVARIVVDRGMDAVDAQAGAVVVASDDGGELAAVHVIGFDNDRIRNWRGASSGTSPAADVVRSREPLIIESAAEWLERYPVIAADVIAAGFQSLAALPLEFEGEPHGALSFHFREPRTFDQADRLFMSGFAQQASHALERVRLYQSEKKARAEAEAASRAKSDFLAVMSHELRTPLNAIIGYTSLLSESVMGPISASQKDGLGRVDASARHLLTLIDQILSLSRLEAGKEQLAIGAVDIGELVRETATLVRPLAANKQLALDIEIPPAPLLIQTDATKVRQILLNLLSNAVKYTAQGSVAISLRAVDQDVTIEVRDTGPGIPTPQREHLFEPFWQAEQGRTRHQGGTGLGLSVAQHLARLLGGEISVPGDDGGGATFIVRLPA